MISVIAVTPRGKYFFDLIDLSTSPCLVDHLWISTSRSLSWRSTIILCEISTCTRLQVKKGKHTINPGISRRVNHRHPSIIRIIRHIDPVFRGAWLFPLQLDQPFLFNSFSQHYFIPPSLQPHPSLQLFPVRPQPQLPNRHYGHRSKSLLRRCTPARLSILPRDPKAHVRARTRGIIQAGYQGCSMQRD